MGSPGLDRQELRDAEGERLGGSDSPSCVGAQASFHVGGRVGPHPVPQKTKLSLSFPPSSSQSLCSLFCRASQSSAAGLRVRGQAFAGPGCGWSEFRGATSGLQTFTNKRGPTCQPWVLQSLPPFLPRPCPRRLWGRVLLNLGYYVETIGNILHFLGGCWCWLMISIGVLIAD